MRPEDIDKLFGDKLKNTSPTPPADMWNRLQQRMAEEMPQPQHQIQPEQEEEKKRGFLWVYSSVAASLSLLLSAGLIYYNLQNGNPELQETIAKKDAPALVEEPVYTSPAVTETPTLAQTEKKSENISEAQATEKATAASNTTEAVSKAKLIAKAEPAKESMKPTTTKATITTAESNGSETAIAATTPSENAAPVAPEVKSLTPSSLAEAQASTVNLNAEPVEITIKRAIASQTTAPAPVAEPELNGFEKKTRLAKNIFKQVRNLSNGEPVELSQIVQADKISLETRIGKQRISKTINL